MYNNILDNIVLYVDEDNKDTVTLKGKVVLDKEAGTEIAKGMSTLGSNIGLGACVGAMAGGVSKMLASSSIPPLQKVGLLAAGGLMGAALHAGASAINAQSHKINSTSINNTENTSLKELSKDINKFLDSNYDISPLEVLLSSLYVLNMVSVWLLIIILAQLFFKYYVISEPELNVIDRIFPSYSNRIKSYIYKLIKVHKSMSNIYIIIALCLLLISLIGSVYFATELYNNISNYIDVYIQSKK
jgi:hypothetical protein